MSHYYGFSMKQSPNQMQMEVDVNSTEVEMMSVPTTEMQVFLLLMVSHKMNFTLF